MARSENFGSKAFALWPLTGRRPHALSLRADGRAPPRRSKRFDAKPPAVSRCIVIAGFREAFASGADIASLAERFPSRMLSSIRAALSWSRIAECRKPLVAAVSGGAWRLAAAASAPT